MFVLFAVATVAVIAMVMPVIVAPMVMIVSMAGAQRAHHS